MKTNRPTFYFANPDEAENAFYSAFEMCDLQLMNAVLANHEGCCIHPGASPVIGRESILESWSHLFSQMSSAIIHIENISRKESDDFAVHVVAEHFAESHQPNAETSLVLATNVYIQQNNGWRLLSHHASPIHEKRLEQQIMHQAPSTLQ